MFLQHPPSLSRPAMDSSLIRLVLILAISELTTVTPLSLEAIPRVTFLRGDPRRMFARFSRDGHRNYSTLLLSEEMETLYVGARDVLFAVNTSVAGQLDLIKELPWKATESKVRDCSFKGKSKEWDCFNFIRILLPLNASLLYTCGTFAFSPSCAYIDVGTFSMLPDAAGNPRTEAGKGRCPFDPRHKYTATIVDGELYTGTTDNFQGTESSIFRNLGPRVALKTERSSTWLQDPTFVGSSLLPESDGDKIYFFFTEARSKTELRQKLRQPMVARVCKSDVGGERVLQKRWITFLKAQLLCYLPDDQFPFNVLQDVFVSGDGDEPVVYGIFTSQWPQGSSDSSAVCAFSFRDIQAVFNGSYKMLDRVTQSWSVYTHHGQEPRPGACDMDPSMDFTLNRVKDLFLMEGVVYPIERRPLLVKVRLRYTKIAVDTVLSVTSVTYRVLFLITASGYLHKAVEIDSQPHIIEELQLFHGPESVHSVLLSSKMGVLYISSSTVVLEVPVSNCTVYPSCGQCVLSRDPYCAWDPHAGACRETRGQDDVYRWIQDIERAAAGSVCSVRAQPRMYTPKEVFSAVPAEPVVMSVQVNTLVTLPCRAPSSLAQRNWTLNGEPASGSEVIEQPLGLWLVATPGLQGVWECWATENGYRALLVSYSLQVSAGERPAGAEGQLSRAGVTVTTYWNELVLVSVLFVVSVLTLVAYIGYHRSQSCWAWKRVRVSQSPPDSGEQEEIRPGSPSPGSDTQMHQTHHPGAEGNLQGSQLPLN
ncbi:semaphorin-4B-like isoform X2 [Hemiscyllium ocellatum]|nr:semaphorin-4B-like isoform X2 [Hemiscyllium ocellatum]XP_060676788.1 semaphorin-4B-like isoform X2 [Hemiscyllium ocellatum]XP_060676789.1 semaphorin-4B-like isoform X2 [Hemiscyllium ocellatum]XP_060676790.1 semaphorin-4B-like isoform X2 [Hemiscyllium ocellatum]